MNISTRKLFAAQKNAHIKFSDSQLLDIPEPKKISDILMIFQNYFTKKPPLEFISCIDDFISGYNLSLNLKLKEVERLQLKILIHGMSQELFNNFSKICKITQDNDWIADKLENKSLEYNNLDICIAGFKAAEKRIMEICEYILKEQSIRNLQNECVYTNFWDFVNAEIILFPDSNQIH